MATNKTNLYMNWDTLTITPAGGSAIPIIGVMDIRVDGKSVQKAFYGDNRMFARLLRNTAKTRSITIVGGDIAALLSIPEETLCGISAVLNDANNMAGPGAITLTVTGAKRESCPFGGKNNEYGEGTLTFHCQGTAVDGDPVTYAVAANIP